MNTKFGKEEYDVGSRPETIEEVYGAGADSAALDKRNDSVIQEIGFTISYFKDLEKDAQSPDPETRYRAKIKMELFNNGCHPEKIDGVWRMVPGSRKFNNKEDK